MRLRIAYQTGWLGAILSCFIFLLSSICISTNIACAHQSVGVALFGRKLTRGRGGDVGCKKCLYTWVCGSLLKGELWYASSANAAGQRLIRWLVHFVLFMLYCFVSLSLCVYSIAIGSIFVCKCICVFLFVFTLLCANIAIIRGLVEACGLFYAHSSSSTLFFSLPLPSNGRIVLVQSSFGEFNSTHLRPKAAGFVATTRGKRDFENA